MNRRNDLRRLSRSKSTSSVQGKHDPIIPEVSRHHAQAAAMLAFSRARERKRVDGECGGCLSRSNTVHDQQPLSHQTLISGDDERVIKRQHSVRFSGPNAVQRRKSIGTRAVETTRLAQSLANPRPVAITTTAAVPAAYRPPSRSSSIGKASSNKVTRNDPLTAGVFEEYYSREDEVASTPSSYRRLRRSKSMFSPLKAPNVFYTNGTPKRPGSPHIRRHNSVSNSHAPHSQPSQVVIRSPKSTGFLRCSTGNNLLHRNDAELQLARDRFLRETTQQRVREQPSFLFRSKTQPQKRPFRKSVRSSSANSYDLSVSWSHQNPPPKESILREATRKASRSIKNKFKKVFSRNRDIPSTIPTQQVKSKETHVRQYNGDSDRIHGGFENIPRPDEAALSRVASRAPSIHIASSKQQLKSHTGSVRSAKSFQSDQSDISRVNSWNSMDINTITSQGTRAQVDGDLQRLSIINEVGSHFPSSSFRQSKTPSQFSAYPLVHQARKSADHAPGLVDSARVYSALMKRLDENNPNARLQPSQNSNNEDFTANHSPVRNSSVVSGLSNRKPATIRHVSPDDLSEMPWGNHFTGHDHQWVRADSIHSAQAEDMFGYTGTHVHQWVAADPLREARMKNSDDVFSPGNDMNKKEILPVELQLAQDCSKVSSSEPPHQGSTQASYHTVPETSGLTPQELAIQNEPVVQGGKILREARSIFFGGTTAILARTTSPFRRAMTDADHNSALAVGDGPVATGVSSIRNPLYLGPEGTGSSSIQTAKSPKDDNAYTESLYSRTTSGQTPAATTSALSLPLGEGDIPDMSFPSTGTGDVVIINTTTYRPTIPGSIGHRVTSSNGSTEWKKWMTSEVAKLERARESTYLPSAHINCTLPASSKSFHSRHVRENAQIDDDDADAKVVLPRDLQEPLRVVQLQNPNIPDPPLPKSILKNRSTGSLVENHEPSSSIVLSIPIPPPPPIPVRSPLRSMQSKSSLQSVATISSSRTGSIPSSMVKTTSLSGRNLLHKRSASQTTFRDTRSGGTRAVVTPSKLKKNCHPYINDPVALGEGQRAMAGQRSCFSSGESRCKIPGAENVKNTVCGDMINQKDDLYSTESSGLIRPRIISTAESEVQALGSKGMVETFLSSRRRRIAGGSEESEGAFL